MLAQILSTRIVVRLRALIVLPTRDLVSQVRDTMEQVGKGRGLKVLDGSRTPEYFAHDWHRLVQLLANAHLLMSKPNLWRKSQHGKSPTQLNVWKDDAPLMTMTRLQGGSSSVDILICTPGRL